MRITLETTNTEPKFASKSIIEIPTDDGTIYDVIEKLVIPCLLGFGFASETIQEIFSFESESEDDLELTFKFDDKSTLAYVCEKLNLFDSTVNLVNDGAILKELIDGNKE